MKTAIKFRPLAPVERAALEESRELVKAMCDLLRMVQGWPVATLARGDENEDDGAMRQRFFELNEQMSKLPLFSSKQQPPPEPERKPLFTEQEKMRLGPGYSEHDKERIRAITAQLVEGKVIKGELNPDDAEALKKAVKEAAHVAKSAYNAALEYVSG